MNGGRLKFLGEARKVKQLRKQEKPVKVLRVSIIVLSIFPLFFFACSSQPADCVREDIFCVGLVTAYDGVDDHGLNQAAWETLQNIKGEAQIVRLDMIESVDPRDWQKNILFFAENGYDVVVAVGRELSNDTVILATQYPQPLFIGIDQQLEEVVPNVATIHFPEGQAGFLAGMLAAMVTEADNVGAVCETSEIEDVWLYCEGFRAGATYEKDDVQVTVTYRDNESFDNTFNDPDWGEQKALNQIDRGVDVMSGFGGKTLEGALLTASEKGVLVIGAEGDLYYRLPDVQPVLVSSVINDPSVELSQIVSLARQGEISAGPHEGQVTLVPFRNQEIRGITEIQSAMEKAVEGIRNGVITIDLPEKK